MVRIKIVLSILLIYSCTNLWSQQNAIEGTVTFVTSSNIYARFESTDAVKIGDTLRLGNGSGMACLLVTSKSTTSCVCSILNECSVEKSSKVWLLPTVIKEEVTVANTVQEKMADTVELEKLELQYPQEIRARISASTYSTVSNDREDRHRLMSSLSIVADHINDSKFSADIYMNFRQIFNESATASTLNNTQLRIYNLGVRYEATPTLSMVLGRNINAKIASLGAIDGLQVEKQLGNNYVGAIVGSRPDIFDFGYNPDLLEYGAYYGLNTNSKNMYSQTTVGAIEQRGNGDIDRRYAYLQHSSTLFKKFNLFTSAEMDLFSKVDFTTKNEFRLTNFYASARYRLSRAVNFMVSYDTRKRIIYYETFRSAIDQLLNDDLARQGIRARINIRPVKNVYTGFSYSKRFQSDQQNQSDNMYGYLTLSKTPFIEGRTSLSYNRNESNYLLSNIASFRHSRSFMRNRLSADLYYRFLHYDYASITDNLIQHFVGTDLSYNITRNLLFSITGEYSMYENSKNYRVYTRLVQRFYSKHKN